MSERMQVQVRVDEKFWEAFDEDDFDAVEELLVNALTLISFRVAKEGGNDSILASHLRNCMSSGSTFDDGSISVDHVEWGKDRRSGTIKASFSEYEYRGCRDLDYQADRDDLIPFEIIDEGEDDRTLWVEVREEPGYFSPE